VEIKKGDIVGRISYGKDILFYVNKIIKVKNGKSYAILRGVNYRIEASAPIDDLEKMEKSEIEKARKRIEKKLKKRIDAKEETANSQKRFRNTLTNAVVLHLDGDRRYTQKSEKYYRKLGLRAIVKNIPENRQPQVIRRLD